MVCGGRHDCDIGVAKQRYDSDWAWFEWDGRRFSIKIGEGSE